MKRGLIIGLSFAFAIFLWGCSTQSQDPVSSLGPAGNGGAPALHKSVGTPTNVSVVATGTSVTATWDSVAFSSLYHILVTMNGDTVINVLDSTGTKFIATNLQPGSYSLTIAAIVSGFEGSPTGLFNFTISSLLPPTVTAIATPIVKCFREGEWVTVAFSGVVVNTAGGATYVLSDEYKKIHYAGTVSAGPYLVNLKLKDRRAGYDRNGRQYTFTITATNAAGTATATVVVTVPLDRTIRDHWVDDDDSWGWGWGWNFGH
ncbi:MAG TPA: fibronectin type III domain-containing protein [Bacteroidota bacterium]|nr:fibronectin type III domain-containing protein [Bacteroidota bacterium]